MEVVRQVENLFVCFGAKPKQSAWTQDLPRDRKWGRKGRSDRRQGWVDKGTQREESTTDRRIDQSTTEGRGRVVGCELAVRRDDRVNRSQKGDCEDLMSYARGRVNQHEKVSALLGRFFVEISRKIQASVSLQMHGECKVSHIDSPLLALGVDPSPYCSFVLFLRLSWLYFLWP